MSVSFHHKGLFSIHGPLARYVRSRVAHAPGIAGNVFLRQCRLAIPTCITARESRTCRDECRDRQLAVSFEVGWWRGKRFRYSRRIRNPLFYVSGNRPLFLTFTIGIFRQDICENKNSDVFHQSTAARIPWMYFKMYCQNIMQPDSMHLMGSCGKYLSDIDIIEWIT